MIDDLDLVRPGRGYHLLSHEHSLNCRRNMEYFALVFDDELERISELPCECSARRWRAAPRWTLT